MDVILDLEWPMTIGTTPKQADRWRGAAAICEGRAGKQSVWAVLYQQGDRLFGDELFVDLFAEVGRRSVPPRIVATVMVLQRLQGCSDREAVEAFSFDARWKYACSARVAGAHCCVAAPRNRPSGFHRNRLGQARATWPVGLPSVLVDVPWSVHRWRAG